MISSLTRWVLRHRLAVVGGWLVLTVAGVVAASSLGGALSQQFSVPGSTVRTSERIAHEFGSGGQVAPLVAVVNAPGRDLASRGYARQAEAAFARLAAAEPGSRLASFGTTGNVAFLSGDRHTEFALVFPAPTGGDQLSAAAIDSGRRAVAGERVAGASVLVSGLDALRSSGASDSGTGVVVEALFGALGALAVLALLFGSFLAVVPLLIAGAAIMTTLLVVRGLAALTSVSMIVQYLIALIGLGVAVDYSLLVIVRWREERAAGAGREESVVRAMATADRTVAFSGLTVGIGLLALVVLPVPFLRSIGVAGMLIPVISVVVALTLLPVILLTIGHRLDWPRIRSEAHGSRRWVAWGRWVVRRRAVCAGVGLAVHQRRLVSRLGGRKPARLPGRDP